MLAERLRNNWMQKLPNHDEPDDSLTSLAWLYDMHPIGLDLETPCRGNEIPASNVAGYPKYLANENQPFAGSLLDPQVRMDYRTKWTGKPPFSYATLICLAMRELGKPKVTLSDIYGWIMSNFAYYRHTDSSWQNSVRHNLSLNKCFEKVPRDKGERGKGGFWRVNPRHADWLEANLAKCRRAAPPPGPPPPMPRSMLLHHHQQQQQQHQQGIIHSTNFLTPGSMTLPNSITFTQCPTPQTTTTYISEISWESSKLNRVPALSPSSSASSHSSLSSSPLSFPSVGSPVALSNKVPQNANMQTVSPSISTIFRNQTALSELPDTTTATTSVSHFSLPAVCTSSHVSQNSYHHNHHQVLATHRRKSPLFHQHQDSDNRGSTLDSDDELNFAHEDDPLLKSERHNLKKTPNHLPRFTSRTGRLNEISKTMKLSLTNQTWNKESPPSSGHANFKSKSNNCRSDYLGSKLEPSGLVESNPMAKIRRTKLKSVKRTVSDSSESRLIPTRILPPRRRYSRWALPKSRQDYQDKDEFESTTTTTNNNNKQTSNSDRKPSNQLLADLDNRKIKREPSPANRAHKFPLSPFLSTFEGTEDDDEDDDVDYVWPPIRRDVIDSNLKDKPRFADSFVPNQQTSNHPSHVSHARTMACESSDSVSNYSRSNSKSPQSRTNPKEARPSVGSGTVQQLTSPGLESTTPLCPQSDRSNGFKWDSMVFLSDNHRLDQLFSPDRSNGADALDIFGAMPDEDAPSDDQDKSQKFLDFSACSESDLDLSHPNSSKLSSADLDDSRTINNDHHHHHHHPNDSYQTTMSDSASPLLDDLDLEPNDLNFDSFDGLVESTGPIPLDIDFSLTASFSGSYSTSTSDIIMDSQDLGATLWPSTPCQSDKQRNPSPYFVKSDDPNGGASASCSSGTDLLGLPRTHPTDQMWFNDSQSLMASSHSLAMLLNEASVHLFEDMPTTLNDSSDLNRLTTPPLN